MHYLVDGHNLIGHLQAIELGDPNDEVKLILLLRSWAAAGRKRELTLYFDSGSPGGKVPELSSGPVKVVFASGERSADDMLIYQVKRVTHPGAYTLVTSDREIVAWAKKRRMPTVTSAVFAKRLESEQQARRAALAPDEGEDPLINADEVNEWLSLFGPVAETAPPPPPPRRAKRSTAGEPPRPPRDPAELKTSGDLTEDELSAWLDLFGSSGDG